MKPTRKNSDGDITGRIPPHTPRYRVTGGNNMQGGRRPVDRHLRPARTVKYKIAEENEPMPSVSTLRERFNGWRLGVSLEGEHILKAVIIALLVVVLTIIQTTFFTRFRPFGVVPDLMLPFVIAVAAVERERWGAVTALVSAYVIDAAGGTEITLLPLLYVPAAFTVGILTTHRFRDSFSVAALYTVVTSLLRGVITFIIASVTVNGITAPQVFVSIVLPEFAANVLLAAFPQLLTRVCLRPFHKTRAERTGSV